MSNQELALTESILAWKLLAACRYGKSEQVIVATDNLIAFWKQYNPIV